MQRLILFLTTACGVVFLRELDSYRLDAGAASESVPQHSESDNRYYVLIIDQETESNKPAVNVWDPDTNDDSCTNAIQNISFAFMPVCVLEILDLRSAENHSRGNHIDCEGEEDNLPNRRISICW